MSKFDADISRILYDWVFPSMVVIILVYYFVKIDLKKVEAVIQSKVCGWLHRRYFENEKRLLFEGFRDFKNSVRDPIRILEIGVGSGVNFKYYPKGTLLSCVDPNPHHENYWKKNLTSYRQIRLEESFHTGAENMPEVGNNSYDAVVCTLTLCSVQDPAAVLKEVNRVLKPGGTFFFLEHVAGKKGSIIRISQNLMQVFWPYLSAGCHLNRETWTFLDNSLFQKVEYRLYSVNVWLFYFFRPCLYGRAVK